MNKHREELYIYQNIIRDMKEGILVVNMKGRIIAINPAGSKLLHVDENEKGAFYVFFSDSRNDEFSQVILDSIYEKSMSHNAVVDYFHQDKKKKLFVNTSYLKQDNLEIGVIAVINDVTELMELKDAVVAMNKIKELNRQLEVRNEFIKDIFGRYLSDTIVDDILERKTGPLIGGEKKEVTMIFSDLRGFTAISEIMDAQQLIEMLNHYLELMIGVISRFQGTILEFIGDAIVAVFGAPVSTDKAEEDAVYCAVQMQQMMEQVNRFNNKKGYPELEMGVAVHTGEVIIGNIGSQKKLKYDIIGKHVNLTSRIESYSVGGQVLISKQTVRGISKELHISAKKEVWPKGMKEPIMIYEILGIGEEMLPIDQEKMKELAEALSCDIRILEEKDLREEKRSAEIIAYSKKQAVIKASFALKEYTNLEILCKELEFYAKVLSRKEDLFVVRATYGDFQKLEG